MLGATFCLRFGLWRLQATHHAIVNRADRLEPMAPLLDLCEHVLAQLLVALSLLHGDLSLRFLKDLVAPCCERRQLRFALRAQPILR